MSSNLQVSFLGVPVGYSRWASALASQECDWGSLEERDRKLICSFWGNYRKEYLDTALIESLAIHNRESRKELIKKVFSHWRYTLGEAQATLRNLLPQNSSLRQVVEGEYSSKWALCDALIRTLDAQGECNYNVEFEKVLLAATVAGFASCVASRALASPSVRAYPAAALGALAIVYYAPETLNLKNLAGLVTGLAASGLGCHPAVATCAGLGTALLTRMPVVHEAVRGAGRLAERATDFAIDTTSRAFDAAVEGTARFGLWTVRKVDSAARGIGSVLERANSAFDRAAVALSQKLRRPCSEEHFVMNDGQRKIEVHSKSWR